MQARWPVLSLLLAGLLLDLRVARAEIVEGVAAVVGKDIILLSEVNARLRPLWKRILAIKDPAARREALKQAQRRALEELIQEKLLEQEARRRHIQVTQEEMNRAVSQVLRQNNLSYKEFLQILASEGKTLQQYKEEVIRPKLLRLKVIGLVVRSRVSVSDADVRAFYEQQKRKLGVETKVRVSVIRLPYGDSVEGARRMAASIAAELRGHPERFAALARKWSRHESAAGGGDLGFVERGVLPPEVEDRVFSRSVRAGTLVGPVETDDGIYLVWVRDRKESEALPFEKVRDKLRQQLLMKRLEEQTVRWLEELRAKTYVDIRL